MSNTTVSVLGGGSFGTVIANIIAENGYDVHFWMRSQDQVLEVNSRHENSSYLPGYLLHNNVNASNETANGVICQVFREFKSLPLHAGINFYDE